MRYNHHLSLSFEIESDAEDAEDLTYDQVYTAIAVRLNRLGDTPNIKEAVLPPEDTYEIFPRRVVDYLKRHDECPLCGHSQCERGSINFENGSVYQNMHCTSCEGSWTVAYKMVNYLSHED